MSILEAPVQRTIAPAAREEELQQELPVCLQRDNLTSPYFPNTSRAWFCVIAVLCIVFAATSFNRLNHTDLWGHLSYGRWIAQHGTLPAIDPFFANASETPVLNYAWLAQLIGYWTKTTFGNEGLLLGHAILTTLTAAAVIFAVARRGTPLIWASAAGLAMLLLDLPIVGTIRPQLFGQLGLAGLLVACSELPRRRHPLFWLPIWMALWSNLHSSIAIGLAVLGIYAAGIVFETLRETKWSVSAAFRDSRVRTILAAVIVATLGACLNPHGPWILFHSLSFGSRETLSHISEWRRTEPASLTFVLLAVSLVVTAFAFRFSTRKWKLYEVALLALFSIVTLLAIRMLAWWAIVWPWLVLPHLASAVANIGRERGFVSAEDEPTAMRTLMAIALVFTTLIVAPPTFSIISGNGRGEVPATVTETPVHVTDELVRRGANGKFFAPMDWADYILWRTDAQMKPLLYSHVHLSNGKVWNDYAQIFAADKSALDRLRANDIRYVVASRERTPQLMKLLLSADAAGDRQVRVIYRDQKSVIAEIDG
jgi:hypothetical protein